MDEDKQKPPAQTVTTTFIESEESVGYKPKPTEQPLVTKS